MGIRTGLILKLLHTATEKIHRDVTMSGSYLKKFSIVASATDYKRGGVKAK
jgi:hypothetical protein